MDWSYGGPAFSKTISASAAPGAGEIRRSQSSPAMTSPAATAEVVASDNWVFQALAGTFVVTTRTAWLKDCPGNRNHGSGGAGGVGSLEPERLDTACRQERGLGLDRPQHGEGEGQDPPPQPVQGAPAGPERWKAGIERERRNGSHKAMLAVPRKKPSPEATGQRRRRR